LVLTEILFCLYLSSLFIWCLQDISWMLQQFLEEKWLFCIESILSIFNQIFEFKILHYI